jgi:DNA-binding Lrp family transcriptional regulator
VVDAFLVFGKYATRAQWTIAAGVVNSHWHVIMSEVVGTQAVFGQKRMKHPVFHTERKVLAALQGGFPLSRTPYEDMAGQLGMDTGDLLSILKGWRQDGKLRRIGAIVDHFRVGLSGGAMVVWRVEPERVEKVGAILAGFAEVSHAYERYTRDNWPYNLYTMVHGADIWEVEQIAERMSQACGVSDYRALATTRELKKVPPTYVGGEKGQ